MAGATSPVGRAQRLAGWFASFATLMAAPLTAAPAPDAINLSAELAAITRFQDADQRLQDIGWQLVRGNTGFCSRVVASIGLQVQDAASYGRPEIARSALALKGDFAVQTVAAGSPAALAAGFKRNREIVRIGRFDPNEWPVGSRVDWQRAARAHDHIEALLAEHGGIAITFADGEALHVQPVEVCAARFELMGEGTAAAADGARVVIGVENPAFAYDDAMFAAMVAHELAHNLLGHTAWLDRNGRTSGKVRRTEREADRLMPWLLANSGYAPEVAVRFMQEWGSRHAPKLLRAPTHDGWAKRAQVIAGELPLITRLRSTGGRADWSRQFRREIDPAQGS